VDFELLEPVETNSWQDDLELEICYLKSRHIGLREACFLLNQKGYSDGEVMRRYDSVKIENSRRVIFEQACRLAEKKLKK
jgi:hypothetical protein